MVKHPKFNPWYHKKKNKENNFMYHSMPLTQHRGLDVADWLSSYFGMNVWQSHFPSVQDHFERPDTAKGIWSNLNVNVYIYNSGITFSRKEKGKWRSQGLSSAFLLFGDIPGLIPPQQHSILRSLEYSDLCWARWKKGPDTPQAEIWSSPTSCPSCFFANRGPYF